MSLYSLKSPLSSADFKFYTPGIGTLSYTVMAVATIEADEAVALSVFVLIMGIPLKKLLVGVILDSFGHFASSNFKVWLRS